MTLNSGVIEIFDLIIDGDGTTQFVRRGTTTETGH